MKKSNFLLSLLLILGGLFTQGQLFAMKKGKMVTRDTRSQDVRARLQQKILAKKKELEGQQQLANMLLLEKELAERAEQYAQANKDLEESEARMARAFGSDMTFLENERKSGDMQPGILHREFHLEKPMQIALLLQFPKTLDQQFCLENPEFIQKLIESPEPEIQEMGRVGSAIRQAGLCHQDFKKKLEVFTDLCKKMNILILQNQSTAQSRPFVTLIELTREYKKYLGICQTSETTETDRKYYRDLEQLATQYKESLPTVSHLYKATLAKIRSLSNNNSEFTWPDSLQPSLEPEKPETLAPALPPKQKTTTKKKPKQHSKKKKTKTTSQQRKQKSTTVVVTKKESVDAGTERTTQEKTEAPVVTKKESVETPVGKQEQKETHKVGAIATARSKDTSKALAIPPSIRPKLPTLDDSQIVEDLGNPYYVTVIHKLEKYLFYKPTEKSPVSPKAPGFSYHSRVQKYFDNPDQALAQNGHTERCGAMTLAKVKALKAFPHAADWLLSSLGVKDTFTDWRGRKIPRLTLMGQVQPKKAAPIHGVFQWGFLPGTETDCYHRSGTEKVPETMIDEFHKHQFNVAFPALPDNENGNGSNGEKKK